MKNIVSRNNQILFEIKSVSGKKLRTTKKYWNKIISIKHPNIKNKENEIRETMSSPEIIRISKSDEKVFLYYRKYLKNYFCAVVKYENGKGFLITAYLTNKIKEGNLIWKKQK